MTQSSFNPGKSIDDVARAEYRDLWTKAHQRELTPSDSYSTPEQLKAVQFTISGGGPGSDVVFLVDEDGDVKEGFFSYYESQGSHVVAFDARDGQMIYDRLTGNYPEPEELDEIEAEENA